MKSPCKYPGCPKLLDRTGYCTTHANAAKQPDRDYQTKRMRDPRLALAYKIRKSAKWLRVRGLFLSEHPICSDPFGEHARRNRTETATQVHHVVGLIDRPDLAYDESNLMPLCTACHARLEREVRSSDREPIQTQQRPPQSEGGPCFG